MHKLFPRPFLATALSSQPCGLRIQPLARLPFDHVTKKHDRSLATSNAQSLATKNNRTLATHAAVANVEDPTVEVINDRYWQRVPVWKDVEEKDFLSYKWQALNTIKKSKTFVDFLDQVLPPQIPRAKTAELHIEKIKTKADFINDLEEGIKVAPMAISLSPHILSVVDWSSPLDDPIIRQFVPLKSRMVPDHPRLTLDSLHEEGDSPVANLVHRYPDKVLFLATAICPVYCRFCTRSYAVGQDTETVIKRKTKASVGKWEAMLNYIEAHEEVQDVVVSGGDSYHLLPHHLHFIGERLLQIPHVKRFRFATKGLAVCPMRITDRNDGWIDAFVAISERGRAIGKQVAMHTHFNHPNEISWATKQAALSLFQRGVIVRNQTVLLRGVNDDVATMAKLIRQLADMNITPYYVYQCDMVEGVEDLRTPLSTILELEKQIRGTIAGFMMPQFIVDLPGGGGKRQASSFETYDQDTGVSTWTAPGVVKDKVFTYWDPSKTVNQPGEAIDK